MQFQKSPLSLLAAGALSALLFGCGSIPTVSPFVSEKSTLAKTRLDEGGLIAFIPEPGADASFGVDVTNLATGKKYRLDLTPAFYNSLSMPGYSKKLAKDMVSDSVAFFFLPEGKYQPAYNIFNAGTDMSGNRNMGSPKSTGREFTVERGKITSFGRVRVDFRQPFLKKMTLNVYSTGTSILQDIRAVPDTTFSRREVLEQSLESRAR